jgi:hypothetical protein
MATKRRAKNEIDMQLDDALGHKVRDAMNDLLPKGAVFAVAIYVSGEQVGVISNLTDDADVEQFLRLMTDEHARKSSEHPVG